MTTKPSPIQPRTLAASGQREAPQHSVGVFDALLRSAPDHKRRPYVGFCACGWLEMPWRQSDRVRRAPGRRCRWRSPFGGLGWSRGYCQDVDTRTLTTTPEAARCSAALTLIADTTSWLAVTSLTPSLLVNTHCGYCMTRRVARGLRFSTSSRVTLGMYVPEFHALTLSSTERSEKGPATTYGNQSAA